MKLRRRLKRELRREFRRQDKYQLEGGDTGSWLVALEAAKLLGKSEVTDIHRTSLELPELVKDILLDGFLQHLDSGWYTVSIPLPS